MRRLKIPSFFGPLFFSMFLLASTASTPSLQAQIQAAAPAAAPNENYLFCWSKGVNPVAYSSDIFAAVLPQQDPSAIKTAFLAFLQKKYGYKSDSSHSVECVVEPPSIGGLRAAQMNKRYTAEYASKQQLVETGWKNTPSEALASYTPSEIAATNAPINAGVASTRAATAAAAAAYENYMFCYTTTQGASIVYFSDVFNAGPPSGPHGRQGAALGQLFVAFLQKKYGLTSSDHANCAGPSTAGLENAQAYKQVIEDQTKQANKQIVETGWKNQ